MPSTKHKKIFFLIPPLLLTAGFFFLGHYAHALAPISDWPTEIATGLLSIFIWALGLILVLVIQGLVFIASYQEFIGAQAVVLGWVIVRDICNMFFVVILMIIAFGTILHLENYNYKKWLPKLILMAVLINFSKTICGLLIDVTQVVMLTFVNAFKDVGGANLTDMLGISKIVTMSKESGGSFSTIVGAYVLGIIYLIVAIIVIVTMLAMLAMRLVMIWIYVVLSPAAYLLAAFPGGQKYASQWWSEFTKNLIVGPVLAFFLWLSLASLSGVNNISDIAKKAGADTRGAADKASIEKAAGTSLGSNTGTTNNGIGTEAGTPSALIGFVIGIGMLIAGLKISQEIGGAAGSMAGKGMSAVSKGAKIGLGGVAAVTGYRYASGVMKSYGAKRKADREAKYDMGANQLAGAVGKTKQTIAKTLNVPGAYIKNKTWGRAGVKAKEFSQQASQQRETVEQERFNFKNKEGAIGNWEYDAAREKWRNSRNLLATPKSNDEMSEYVDRRAGTRSSVADIKEKEAQRLRQKQTTIDKSIKYGAVAAGAGLGLFTGGLTWPGLGLAAAGAAGVATVPKLAKGVREAGNIDLGIASGFKTKMVADNKEKMKYESDKGILATMDDSTKSSFSRTAAVLEAMDRKLLSADQAKRKGSEIREEMGGSTKDSDGDIQWKDKKLGSYVDNITQKNYPGANPVFDQLKDSDPNVRAKAKRKVSAGIDQGAYSLVSLDAGALASSMGLLTRALKTGEFVKQFSGLTDSVKKAAIVKGLQSEGSFESKEKLARITNFDKAFGTDQVGKEKALGNINYKDLSDIFNEGTVVQQEALQNAVSSYTPPAGKTKIDLFVNAKNQFNGGSPAAQDMRAKLGV